MASDLTPERLAALRRAQAFQPVECSEYGKHGSTEFCVADLVAFAEAENAALLDRLGEVEADARAEELERDDYCKRKEQENADLRARLAASEERADAHDDAGCLDCLFQLAKAHTERDAARAEVERLREAGANALRLIEGLLRDDRIPRSCGACGTPDASCDMDCVAASYLAHDVHALRDALARPAPPGEGK